MAWTKMSCIHSDLLPNLLTSIPLMPSYRPHLSQKISSLISNVEQYDPEDFPSRTLDETLCRLHCGLHELETTYNQLTSSSKIMIFALPSATPPRPSSPASQDLFRWELRRIKEEVNEAWEVTLESVRAGFDRRKNSRSSNLAVYERRILETVELFKTFPDLGTWFQRNFFRGLDNVDIEARVNTGCPLIEQCKSDLVSLARSRLTNLVKRHRKKFERRLKREAVSAGIRKRLAPAQAPPRSHSQPPPPRPPRRLRRTLSL